MERHFAIPGLPLESWQETFAGWLERRYPQVWEARISGNQRETVTGLTTGYYELLSMEAAKNGYAFRIIPRRDLLDEGVLKVMDVSGPGDFLLNCALRILRSLVYNSLVFGKSALEEAILTAVSRRMSPVEGPEDPLLDRLVTESVMVNMGASASRRFFAVPANVYLGRWNRSSSNRPPGTRYVSIAGRRPGILRTLWPQLGPSDWFVEVDSAVAPQTPRDTVMVFDCRPATTALGVLGNPEAKRALVGILRDPGSSWCRVDLPEGKPVRVVLSSWRPTEIRLAGSADGGPGGRVLTLYAGRLPHGWRLAAEFADGTPCSLVSQDPGGPPGGFQGSDSPGAGEDRGKGFFEKVFVVDVSPHGDDCSETPSVVLKLVPADSAGEGFLDRVPELYDKEVCIEALVQACGYDSVSSDLTARSRQEEETGFEDSELVEWISPTPQGDEDPGDDAGRPPVAAEEESRAPGTGEVSGPAGGNPGEDNEDATDDVVPAGGTSGRDPLIVVTYRSKRTCHLVPAEEYPVPVTLELEGPKKWVTGKPAQFQVFFQAKPRSGVVVDEVRFQPGPRFSVLWRRSGEFTVSAGAKVSFRVITAEGEKRFTNVYVTEVPVSVLTPGITR